MSENIIVKVKINSDYHPEIFNDLKGLHPRYRAQHLRSLLSMVLNNDKLETNANAPSVNESENTTIPIGDALPTSSNKSKRVVPYAIKKLDYDNLIKAPISSK